MAIVTLSERAESTKFRLSFGKMHKTNAGNVGCSFQVRRPKRQRTGAVQDLADLPAPWDSRSVLDCGSPLPLFLGRLRVRFFSSVICGSAVPNHAGRRFVRQATGQFRSGLAAFDPGIAAGGNQEMLLQMRRKQTQNGMRVAGCILGLDQVLVKTLYGHPDGSHRSLSGIFTSPAMGPLELGHRF